MMNNYPTAPCFLSTWSPVSTTTTTTLPAPIPPTISTSRLYADPSSSSSSDSSPQTTFCENTQPVMRGDWTVLQDEALRQSVERHGGKNWKAIAQDVGSKTHVQCLQRWNKVIKPGLRKGPWTQSEDECLRLAVSQVARGNWVAVAERVPGRTPKQSRERWMLCLDPSIKKEKWTEEEDAKLLALHAQHGNAWAFLSKQLEGRTENSIKSRMKSLRKREEKTNNNNAASSPPAGAWRIASGPASGNSNNKATQEEANSPPPATASLTMFAPVTSPAVSRVFSQQATAPPPPPQFLAGWANVATAAPVCAVVPNASWQDKMASSSSGGWDCIASNYSSRPASVGVVAAPTPLVDSVLWDDSFGKDSSTTTTPISTTPIMQQQQQLQQQPSHQQHQISADDFAAFF